MNDKIKKLVESINALNTEEIKELNNLLEAPIVDEFSETKKEEEEWDKLYSLLEKYTQRYIKKTFWIEDSRNVSFNDKEIKFYPKTGYLITAYFSSIKGIGVKFNNRLKDYFYKADDAYNYIVELVESLKDVPDIDEEWDIFFKKVKEYLNNSPIEYKLTKTGFISRHTISTRDRRDLVTFYKADTTIVLVTYKYNRRRYKKADLAYNNLVKALEGTD